MIGDKEEASVAANTQTISASRRALLKAGWVIPVVTAINLPVSSFAANVSGGQVREICQEAGLQCTPDQETTILQILRRLFGG